MKSPDTKWFDGYVGQLCIIVDDLEVQMDDPDQKAFLKGLKRVVDKYHQTMQVKGGYVGNTYDFVVITSQYTLEQAGEIYAEKFRLPLGSSHGDCESYDRREKDYTLGDALRRRFIQYEFIEGTSKNMLRAQAELHADQLVRYVDESDQQDLAEIEMYKMHRESYISSVRANPAVKCIMPPSPADFIPRQGQGVVDIPGGDPKQQLIISEQRNASCQERIQSLERENSAGIVLLTDANIQKQNINNQCGEVFSENMDLRGQLGALGHQLEEEKKERSALETSLQEQLAEMTKRMEAMQLDAEKKAKEGAEEAKKAVIRERELRESAEEAKAAAAEELRVVREASEQRERELRESVEQAAIRESELREVIIQQESDIKQGSEQGAVGSDGEREDEKEDEDRAN